MMQIQVLYYTILYYLPTLTAPCNLEPRLPKLSKNTHNCGDCKCLSSRGDQVKCEIYISLMKGLEMVTTASQVQIFDKEDQI